MPDRSPRVRLTLFILATVALILAGAAFLIAVQNNSHSITAVAAQARAAAADAKAADARAEAADTRAEAAADQVAQVHANLCSFLDVMRHAKVDEAPEAQQLFIVYQCKLSHRAYPLV